MKKIVQALKNNEQVVVATLDLETLGVTPSAQVTEAAYIIWKIENHQGNICRNTLYAYQSFIKADASREVREETVAWHFANTQRKAKFENWLEVECTSPEMSVFVSKMAEAFSELGVQAVFIRGKDFDLPIIGRVYPGYLQEFQSVAGVHYHRWHCIRDMEDLMSSAALMNYHPAIPNKAHAALSDCKDNLEAVMHVLDHLMYIR